jgi:metal-responsive CopG/Arc/MetJ family transcriptional regulator
MARRKQENVAQFSVRFPNEVVEEIDQICASRLITRSSWLLSAAKEKLYNERMRNAEELISKIARQEKESQ